MAEVNYNGYTISDQTIKNVLENFATYFGANVNVTSGDRTTVPEGGIEHDFRKMIFSRR